jgi:hypothetical protein
VPVVFGARHKKNMRLDCLSSYMSTLMSQYKFSSPAESVHRCVFAVTVSSGASRRMPAIFSRFRPSVKSPQRRPGGTIGCRERYVVLKLCLAEHPQSK